IATLSAILQKWIADHKPVVSDFLKLGLNVPQNQPKLIGLIMQRFQRNKGAPKPSFQLWIDRITTRAREDLVPSLIDLGGKAAVSPSCLSNPVAAVVPDFASLAPMMLSVGKPVWRLTRQDTGWQGNVWDDRNKAMQEIG